MRKWVLPEYIEDVLPAEAERTESLRDPRSGFTAYVPTGSIKKGEALVKAKQCALCHGEGLKGLGPVPPLAAMVTATVPPLITR